MNKRLIIIGAGGHGRVVADCAEQLGQYQHIDFLDDCVSDTNDPRHTNAHWQIIGVVDAWKNYLLEADFIVAFGNNALRLDITRQLQAANANVVSLIHPSAVISPYASIGQGCVVFAGTVINIGTRIADACIINTSASIDHDCDIGEGVHISPNASVAGGVNVGRLTWLGIGTTVVQYLSILPHCQFGAGTIVIKDITIAGTYVGNPARLIKQEN